MSGVTPLRVERTPDRPGPGPLPDALLKALDVQVRRRIDGLLQGDFQATALGPGIELAQVRRYEPGDDVRQIEWNVTARTGYPHVRVHVAEKNLTSCVLIDSSPSMNFGSTDRRKADVAEGVALALGHFASARGNQLRTLAFGRPSSSPLQLRPGRSGLLGTLRSIRSDPRVNGGSPGLEDALHAAFVGLPGRSALFIVSDFRDAPTWRKVMTRVAHRHDVVALEVVDPRELELVDVGDAWFVDPETGQQLHVDTRDRELRRRFAEAAQAERAEMQRLIRSTGADHTTLSTRGDWLRRLAYFLGHRKRRR